MGAREKVAEREGDEQKGNKRAFIEKTFKKKKLTNGWGLRYGEDAENPAYALGGNDIRARHAIPTKKKKKMIIV